MTTASAASTLGDSWNRRYPDNNESIAPQPMPVGVRFSPPSLATLDLPQGRVLVVVDDAVMALDLQRLLHDAGYRVIGPATTVAEIQRMIERGDIDCAILDLDVDRRGDLLARHALAAQAFDARDGHLWRRLTQPVRPRAAVVQARQAFAEVATNPFTHGARANACGFTGGLRRLPPENHFDQPLSTERRQTGILMDVHSALSQGSLKSRQPQLPRTEPDGQPIESSHLALPAMVGRARRGGATVLHCRCFAQPRRFCR